MEASSLQDFAHKHQARAVPPHDLHPVCTLRPEHVDHARIGIAAIIGANQCGQRVWSLEVVPVFWTGC